MRQKVAGDKNDGVREEERKKEQGMRKKGIQ
jgi:hypothetical protein